MKRSLLTAALVGAALAVSIGLGSAASASPRTAQHAQQAQHVRASSEATSINVIQAGSQDFSSADVQYWMDLMGNKFGIDVHYNLISDAATALKTIIAGQADFFIGSLPTAILAVVNAGAPIHVLAANDQASDYVLVGLPGVTLQNLNGKTMGIDSPGSAGHVAAEIGLTNSGVDPDIIHYVTIGGSSARLTAILAGKIDLAPIHYPLALIAIGSGKANLVVNVGKSLGPYIQSGLIASDSFTSKNPQLTQKVVNAFIISERWANANKYKYISYAASKGLDVGLNGPQMAQTWDYYKDVNFFGINGGICNKYITDTIKLNWTLGALPKPIPVGRSKLFDSTYVKTYLKAHHQKPGTC